MTRRPALTIAALLAAALVLTACGKRSDQAGTPQSSRLRLILDYLPNADHVGIYMAQARGEFRKAGLDVQIQTPSDAGLGACLQGILAAGCIHPHRTSAEFHPCHTRTWISASSRRSRTATFQSRAPPLT